jgi:hypothetical protein
VLTIISQYSPRTCAWPSTGLLIPRGRTTRDTSISLTASSLQDASDREIVGGVSSAQISNDPPTSPLATTVAIASPFAKRCLSGLFGWATTVCLHRIMLQTFCLVLYLCNWNRRTQDSTKPTTAIARIILSAALASCCHWSPTWMLQTIRTPARAPRLPINSVQNVNAASIDRGCICDPTREDEHRTPVDDEVAHGSKRTPTYWNFRP